MSDRIVQSMAKRIPANIRKVILEEGFIDKATNVALERSPMEFLFEVYEEFLDPTGEHNDWYCTRCREHILSDWRKMKPFLEQMQSLNQ